ncbi:MAG: hypothetical protein ACI93T_003527 [Porticoccaceae bacterium]|jgi:hypothetical protein
MQDGHMSFDQPIKEMSQRSKERVANNFPFSVARDSVASASSGLTTRRGCEFLVGWNKHRAVPAEGMSITIRIAGTARRLFQPTVGELKNSQTGSVVHYGEVISDTFLSADDLGHALDEFLWRADQDVHPRFATLFCRRFVVLGSGVVAQCA